MKMNTIPEIIDDIRNGKMVILIDDEDRENEGDLILATDFTTPDSINFMATEARGLICLALEPEQIDRLGLPLMVGDERNMSPNKTAFTVSIEAAEGVSTGISASDRARTIRVAANPNSRAQDIIAPGHVFPIRAQKGGVLKRAGHTEASVDLARLAGLTPAAVICEVMKEDGTMARLPDLVQFAKKHAIKIGTIEDLIRYQLENATLVEEQSSAPFESAFGKFQMHVFRNLIDNSHSVVLQKGPVRADVPTLVRVHVENIFSDALKGLSSKPSVSLHQALECIGQSESGVLVYLRKEGMESQIAQWSRQDSEHRPIKMDPREYGIGAQILRQLGVGKIHLLAGNRTSKVVGLKGFGLEAEKIVSFDSNDQHHDEFQDRIFASLLK
jgi:3,4-dihydroxy 2-butanone 4-phosphate synthase/GTP cyclohydrolase II